MTLAVGGVGTLAWAVGPEAATVTESAVRLDDAVQVAETVPPPTTPYRLPVDPALGPGWNPTHASYPATDVFLPCGDDVVSPVRGTVLEVRRVDSWDPAVDNPATRGGRSVAILGADGVRYYFAHFQSIEPPLAVGQTVDPGDRLGALGESGRTSACHLHFGISPPCPGKEWSVRRGVVWPYPYLDSWRAGGQRSPAAEVAELGGRAPERAAPRPWPIRTRRTPEAGRAFAGRGRRTRARHPAARTVRCMAFTDQGAAAPSNWLRLMESRAVFELGAAAAAAPWLRLIGRGDNHPVLILPGFMAGDPSTAPLR